MAAAITEKQRKRILQLLAGGKLSFAEIAEAVNTAPSTVSKLAQLYDFRSPLRRSWSPDEDRALLDKQGTWQQVARQLGRAESACKKRLKLLETREAAARLRGDGGIVAIRHRADDGSDAGATKALGNVVERHISHRAQHYGITPEQYKSLSINIGRQ